MDILATVSSLFADDRFAANLIAFYSVVVLTVLAALIARRLLARGGTGLADLTRTYGLESVGEEAARRLRALLFWATTAAVVLTTAAGLAYHSLGGDVRNDLGAWYEQRSP